MLKNGAIQRLTQTLVISEKNESDQRPPSLPTPEFLMPPNGVRKSLCIHVLTQIIPLSTRSANCLPLSASSVQIELLQLIRTQYSWHQESPMSPQ